KEEALFDLAQHERGGGAGRKPAQQMGGTALAATALARKLLEIFEDHEAVVDRHGQGMQAVVVPAGQLTQRPVRPPIATGEANEHAERRKERISAGDAPGEAECLAKRQRIVGTALR